MTADDIKAREEQDVFDLFVRLTKLPIKSGSIKRPVSGLDFECTLESGQKATYELVKLDSEQTSLKMNNFLDTSSAWSSALKALPPERRKAYLERYRGYTIDKAFKNHPGSRDCTKRARRVIDALLDQPPGFTGALELNGDKVVVEKQSQAVWGTTPQGPFGTGNISITPEPPVWTNIRDKLVGKHYRVADRFELIAYSRYDTLLHQAAEDAMTPRAEIQEWLHGSPFSCVWILEWHYKRIYDRLERPPCV